MVVPPVRAVEGRRWYRSTAARLGSDVVCLPESLAYRERADQTMHEHAEELDREPVSSLCAERAWKGRMNVVCATLNSFDGKTIVLSPPAGKESP